MALLWSGLVFANWGGWNSTEPAAARAGAGISEGSRNTLGSGDAQPGELCLQRSHGREGSALPREGEARLGGDRS